MVKIGDLLEREQQQIEDKFSRRIEDMRGLLISIGHDLRAPMITIKTFLGYLVQDIADNDRDGIIKDIAFIKSAEEKATKMLEYILEYSRVGRVIGDSVICTFQEITEGAYVASAGRISSKKINFQASKDDVIFFADWHRLAQIWQNLIDNAAKYMGNQICPQIKVGVEEKNGEETFFVCDNGIGIDPKHKDRVFSLFSQLNPEAEGTGFGLALVKRIIELYGGRIWFESEGLGKGTCFYFTLPLAVKK